MSADVFPSMKKDNEFKVSYDDVVEILLWGKVVLLFLI